MGRGAGLPGDVQTAPDQLLQPIEKAMRLL